MDAEVTTKPDLIPTHINPLIDPDGDTYRVRSALNFISEIFIDAKEGVTLSCDASVGLAVILETCNAALEHME